MKVLLINQNLKRGDAVPRTPQEPLAADAFHQIGV